MCIPCSGRGSSCGTARELIGLSVPCCGFLSPRLESWQLLMCFVGSELKKAESVKAKVFVKPFLKLPETC